MDSKQLKRTRRRLMRLAQWLMSMAAKEAARGNLAAGFEWTADAARALRSVRQVERARLDIAGAQS